MQTIDIGDEEIPIAELRNQGGLKRDIVELIRKMPTPDRECETSDFLYALQYVLDEHGVSKEPISFLEFTSQRQTAFNKCLDKFQDYSEALATAINAIEEERGVIKGCDSESVVKMIRHIAQHGIDDLKPGDRTYLSYLNSKD